MDSHKFGTRPAREDASPESCGHFRIGLPILPVRYAVLDADSKLPGLDAAFEDPALPGLGQGARYGLRLLRRGYVYVYNENYRKLDGYMVTRKGTLSRLLPGVPEPPDQEPTFNCQWQEHWGPAACLTVVNAQVATRKIWICFSDVQWTRETCDAHRDPGETGAALRRRHMVPFDVREWLATQRHAHAAPIETIDAHVAEFATGGMAPSAISRAFEWSITPPLERAGTLSTLIKAGAHRLAPGKGLLLALPDPVGVAQDLNALIKYKLARFMARDEREWKLTTSVAIEGIREACTRQELDRRRIERISRMSLSARPQTSAAVEALKRAVEDAGNFSDAEVEAARQDAWKRYLDDYDEAARAAFDVQFQRDLDALEENTLKPLAGALAAWLRQESMRAVFQCNFDAQDPHSGHSYIGVAWSMICGVTGYSAVAEELLRQMEAEFIDKDAIFKRALLLNSDAAADQIAKVATGGPDLNDEIFWKRVTDLFKDVYTGKLRPNVLGMMRNDLAKLVHELTAPLVRVLSSAAIAMRPQRLQILATLGWIGGMNIVTLKFAGTPAEMEKYLKKQLLARSPTANSKLLKPGIHRMVEQELARTSGVGGTADKVAKAKEFKWFFFVDDDLVRTLGESGNSKQMFEKIKASSWNMQELDQLVHAQYRRYVFNPAHVLGGKTEPALGAVALILEGVALYHMTPASKALNGKERELAEYSIKAARYGLIGSGVELIGETLNRTKWGPMRLSGHVSEKNLIIGTWGRLVANAGRVVGTVGGLISVYVDANKGMDALEREKTGLAAYFFTSAFAGFVFAMGLLFGFISGGMAFVVMLGLALIGIVFDEIAALFGRNELEAWLGRTTFGFAARDRYKRLEEQQTAMAALVSES